MAKTVKEVKEKMLDYAYNIDISKLTLTDLHMLSMVIKSISEIKDDNEDYFSKALSSMSSMALCTKPSTISDLKESE